jgi:hypothetical protein
VYLEKESDRARIMISGAPLSAEKIRMQGSNLGSEWMGTSWFFLQHLVAKEFTKTDNVSFDAARQTAVNYGMTGWCDDSRLEVVLGRLKTAFNKCGVGNVETRLDGGLQIGGLLSNSEFRMFAAGQYEYAMGKGLTKGNAYLGWTRRSMSNIAERILWHYVMEVFDQPQVYNTPGGENHLNALYTHLTETMAKSGIAPRGIEVWKDIPAHTLPLIAGWERGMIAKNVLKLYDFGGVTFVAPAFFADVDGRVIKSAGSFSAESHEMLLELIGRIRRLPAYPVMMGTPQYEMSQALMRAGALQMITEGSNLAGTHYAYLVSRDVFEEFDEKMKYQYSSHPYTEFGDVSITELFFKSLGRARLLGERILPAARAFEVDFKKKIDRFVNELEQHGSAKLPEGLTPEIFQPLVSAGALAMNDGAAVVLGDYQPFVTAYSAYWHELINDPSVLQIKFPPDEVIKRKEESQTANQIKRRLNSYFS